MTADEYRKLVNGIKRARTIWKNEGIHAEYRGYKLSDRDMLVAQRAIDDVVTCLHFSHSKHFDGNKFRADCKEPEL